MLDFDSNDNLSAGIITLEVPRTSPRFPILSEEKKPLSVRFKPESTQLDQRISTMRRDKPVERKAPDNNGDGKSPSAFDLKVELAVTQPWRANQIRMHGVNTQHVHPRRDRPSSCRLLRERAAPARARDR